MGIHNILIGVPHGTPGSDPTWTIVGSDSSDSGSVSVSNCQPGDWAWFAECADIQYTPTTPFGYTNFSSSTDNDPDRILARKTITSAGTETVAGSATSDNKILIVVRSSTGAIRNTVNGSAIGAGRKETSGMPTTPASNVNNAQAPAGALALNVGYLDDDNPSNITPPSGYTFIVEGNVDDGFTSSSLFAAYAVLSSASTSPPSAGNAWTAPGSTSSASDDNYCAIAYLIHDG